MTGPDDTLVWVAIVAIAFGTWAFRASFVFLFGYVESVPPQVDRALQFVPPALLAAIIGPKLLLLDGTLALGPGNERLLAGIVAMAVAWYTEHMVATIVAGMLALWGFTFLL